MSSSNNIDGFEKAINIAKTIRKLGDSKSTFLTWENEVKGILTHYTMDDYEKIRIIMTTVNEDNYDLCNNILYTNENCTADILLKQIKDHLGYSNTSMNSLNKLENIKVKNNNIKKYNLDFKIFLNGVGEADKPSEKRIVNYYVRGLHGTRYYDPLIQKDFKDLDSAIKFVNKMVLAYEEYEGTTPSNEKNQYNGSFKPRRVINNNPFSNARKGDFIKNKTDSPKGTSNEKESDVENLTKQFSKMQLHLCYRCGKPGHIARYCMNDISSENLKYINESHLNQ